MVRALTAAARPADILFVLKGCVRLSNIPGVGMKHRHSLVLITLFALGCSSSDNPVDPSGGGTPPPGDGASTASSADVAAVVASLGSATSAAEIAAELRSFCQTYGLPVLNVPPAAPAARGSADALASASPAVYLLDAQIDRAATAKARGMMIRLESLLGELRMRGLQSTAPPYGPVNSDYLSQRLMDTKVIERLDGNGEFRSDYDLVPALIVQISRDRWQRRSVNLPPGWVTPDSLWGDGWIDPVQFLFLSMGSYLSSAADSAAVPSPARVGGSISGKLAAGLFEGWFKDSFGVPASWKDAMEATLCASVRLFGISIDLSVDRKTIDRPAVDPTVDPQTVDPGNGSVSAITATVTYEEIPHDDFDDLDPGNLCAQPFPGPQQDVALTWRSGGDPDFSAGLDVIPGTTDINGQAVATLRASLQLVPAYLRNLRIVGTGLVSVSARGLLPDWAGLEMAVDLLRQPTQEAVRIGVQSYDHSIGIRYGSSVNGHLTGTPALVGGCALATYQTGGTPLSDGASGDFVRDNATTPTRLSRGRCV